jgi:hypothetical protein
LSQESLQSFSIQIRNRGRSVPKGVNKSWAIRENAYKASGLHLTLRLKPTVTINAPSSK